MKKRLTFWTLSVALILGLVGCGSEGTSDNDTVVSVGSGVEFVEATVESTEEPAPEPTEAPVPTTVPCPVDDATRVALQYIIGWGDEIADSMMQEEAINKLREYAKGGGGAWQSAEDAQEKCMILVKCTKDGTIYADLIFTSENMLSGLFGGTCKEEEIERIYINDVLVDADWTTVEIHSGDYIIMDMGSYVKTDTSDVVEPTEEPAPTTEPEATTELEVEQSEDGTNPAFYNWVSKESEEDDIAWFVENYGVTESELRTWNDEQWQSAFQTWYDGYDDYTPSNNDIDESKIVEIAPGVYEYDNFDEIESGEDLWLPVPELGNDAPAGSM